MKPQLLRRVAVVGGIRIPFVKSFTAYPTDSNQDMLTHVLREMVRRFELRNERLGDVALGAVMSHSADWNLSREVVLGCGLAPETPAFNVQRACGTSLDTVNLIALKIATGQIDSGIAGGSDTNSDLPVVYQRPLAHSLVSAGRAKGFAKKLQAFAGLNSRDLKPLLPGVFEPRTKMSMGQHTEQMAKHWKISREAQDLLALESHKKGAAAYERGFYQDLVSEYQSLTRDPLLRADTSLEKLAKLKPAFDLSDSGTLTAGNSTALTDGAAAVLLASEHYAQKRGLPILAFVRDVEVAAIDYVGGREGLLMAPAYAVSRLLERNGMALQDFDLYEIHEAFAAQVLCTLAAWESPTYCRDRLGRNQPLGALDRTKLNVNGGSLALGHPFAATGARIVASLAKALHERGGGRGLISICTAGGMGVAAILETDDHDGRS